MSRRLKITLPDPLMAHLEAVAHERGEPVSRVAAQFLSAGIDTRTQEPPSEAITPFADPLTDTGSDRRAPWIEPLDDARTWRQFMWGGICALHGRYPEALGHLKEGWWKNSSHVETLCALVVWRNWIDFAADDPRHELAFQAQLADYSRELRQEGGGITKTWKPGAAPPQWSALIAGHRPSR
ncbi:MAG: hypothetical protein ACTHM1_09645 [Solirubrobacteraceae bacterium]